MTQMRHYRWSGWSWVLGVVWAAVSGCTFETTDPVAREPQTSYEESGQSDSTSPSVADRSEKSAAESEDAAPKSEADSKPSKPDTPEESSASTSGSHDGTDAPSSSESTQPAATIPPPLRNPSRRPVPITFDDLELAMKLDSKFTPELLTERVMKLHGQRVSIKGFIYAAGIFQQTGIRKFPLVKNTQCKFGPGGLAYCVILVSLKDDVTTNFTLQPVTVEGILKIEPFEGPDGITWSVYRLEGERVY